jgi:hypothetical protein
MNRCQASRAARRSGGMTALRSSTRRPIGPETGSTDRRLPALLPTSAAGLVSLPVSDASRTVRQTPTRDIAFEAVRRATTAAAFGVVPQPPAAPCGDRLDSSDVRRLSLADRSRLVPSHRTKEVTAVLVLRVLAAVLVIACIMPNLKGHFLVARGLIPLGRLAGSGREELLL